MFILHGKIISTLTFWLSCLCHIKTKTHGSYIFRSHIFRNPGLSSWNRHISPKQISGKFKRLEFQIQDFSSITKVISLAAEVWSPSNIEFNLAWPNHRQFPYYFCSYNLEENIKMYLKIFQAKPFSNALVSSMPSFVPSFTDITYALTHTFSYIHICCNNQEYYLLLVSYIRLVYTNCVLASRAPESTSIYMLLY